MNNLNEKEFAERGVVRDAMHQVFKETLTRVQQEIPLWMRYPDGHPSNLFDATAFEEERQRVQQFMILEHGCPVSNGPEPPLLVRPAGSGFRYPVIAGYNQSVPGRYPYAAGRTYEFKTGSSSPEALPSITTERLFQLTGFESAAEFNDAWEFGDRDLDMRLSRLFVVEHPDAGSVESPMIFDIQSRRYEIPSPFIVNPDAVLSAHVRGMEAQNDPETGLVDLDCWFAIFGSNLFRARDASVEELCTLIPSHEYAEGEGRVVFEDWLRRWKMPNRLVNTACSMFPSVLLHKMMKFIKGG